MIMFKLSYTRRQLCDIISCLWRHSGLCRHLSVNSGSRLSFGVQVCSQYMWVSSSRQVFFMSGLRDRIKELSLSKNKKKY